MSTRTRLSPLIAWTLTANLGVLALAALLDRAAVAGAVRELLLWCGISS